MRLRCTIVLPVHPSHKPWPGLAVLLAAIGLSIPVSAVAQDARPAITVEEMLTVLGAGVAYAAPGVLGLNDAPADCGPCDRSGVPPFDRWIIAEPRALWDDASTGLLAAVAAVTWWDLASSDWAERADLTASIQSAAWAVATTKLIKVIVQRKRPVLYTDLAPGYLNKSGSRESFPSGHTAAVAALATSYLLSRARQSAPPAGPWISRAVLLAAAGVGVLRVTAADHFPSDVLAGAAVGVGSALVVHSIRF